MAVVFFNRPVNSNLTTSFCLVFTVIQTFGIAPIYGIKYAPPDFPIHSCTLLGDKSAFAE